MFNVDVINMESVTCLIPEGRLDTLNSDSFNTVLQFQSDREDYIILDFSKCNYLSSSGIRLLLGTTKKLSAKGGALMLSHTPSEVFQILEIAGLDSIFNIFKDTESARLEILRRRNIANHSSDVKIDDSHFQIDQIDNSIQEALMWHKKDLAGYNELVISAGVGSPAESLTEDPENSGLFITLGNCAGFIPFNEDKASDFRVVKDPANGVIFVNQALSFSGKPKCRITLITPQIVSFEKLIDEVTQIAQQNDPDHFLAAIVADFNRELPSISLQLLGDASRIIGARFIVSQMSDLLSDESLLDFCKRNLTIQNIESVEPIDISADVHSPVIWLCHTDKWTDAEGRQIRVETDCDLVFEPYQYLLTRRLYKDSVRVIVKKLHGGYSAQTYQVDSFDHHGRKLRPTVLKIANRDMISREASRCQEFSLPYIMNNSAMVLGTSFFCDTGALRYNFVGIGGENTKLEWLTHYYNTWPVEKLEPLFDKIFLEILKPWYGQPVKEKIYPYKDHNPLSTFFPRLCEIAEEELSISADEEYFAFEGTGRKILNPYWFLKHEYPKRERDATDYFISVCHGDLNMQNILLDKDMNVYLIDFSETRPRSVVSDFARMEAIFMVESAPVTNEKEFLDMVLFASKIYETTMLGQLPMIQWQGAGQEVMRRNMALISKMRSYASASVYGDSNILPYYIAMLEWTLPIVCFSSVSHWHKKLSACIAGMICEKLSLFNNKVVI